MTNQEPASILLIDDHPMLRTGVKQLVSMAPDITVVGEASNGEQGIELAESLDPDLILLDLNMPGMNGLETLDKLREKSLSGRIVVFSVSNHEEDVVTALKRGRMVICSRIWSRKTCLRRCSRPRRARWFSAKP